MRASELPVVAAIANFNMAHELQNLLPSLIGQGYHEIFVLDDASTDNSRQVVKKFGHKVHFIAGETNKGAGANRNRIITALNYPAIIHFLDADVVLESTATAARIRRVVPNEPFGFIVGLTKTSTGAWNAWNYGPRVGLRSDIGSCVQAWLIAPNVVKNPRLAALLSRLFGSLLVGWPDLLRAPQRKEVYWGIEQNLIIRSDIFAELGGFDETLRETEILELAIRMYRRGLKSYFDPRIVIRHTEGDVRKYDRGKLKTKELRRINRQYGLVNWFFSADRH